MKYVYVDVTRFFSNPSQRFNTTTMKLEINFSHHLNFMTHSNPTIENFYALFTLVKNPLISGFMYNVNACSWNLLLGELNLQ